MSQTKLFLQHIKLIFLPFNVCCRYSSYILLISYLLETQWVAYICYRVNQLQNFEMPLLRLYFMVFK